MKTRPSSILPALVLASFPLSAFLSPGRAEGCSIPVFRYALQFWQPDSFDSLVFHQGALAEADGEAVRKLTAAVSENIGANVNVQAVDLADEDLPEELRALWRAVETGAIKTQATGAPGQGTAKLPHVLTLYPENYSRTGAPIPAESVSLAEVRIESWLMSPARKAITERLARGESAVWVVLGIGDEEKDAAAMKTLTTTLEKLEKTLELPEQVPEADFLFEPDVEVKTELRLAFSALAVARDDAAEKHFVSQLLSSEPDLRDFDEPMVFAVFGRGRALPALVGKGINEEMIGEVAAFLVGPCSCQVKAENPGFDLLLAADWETLLQKANAAMSGDGTISAVEAAPAAAPTDGPPAAPADAPTTETTAVVVDRPAPAVSSVEDAPDPAADETPASRGPMLQSLLIALALGVAALIVGTAIIVRRNSTAA